jgi:hypothetical protein
MRFAFMYYFPFDKTPFFSRPDRQLYLKKCFPVLVNSGKQITEQTVNIAGHNRLL